MSPRGDWALVTGAGKRLGRAVALELARAGFSLAVHYNSSAKEAEETCDEARALGVAAAPFGADLSDESTLEPLVRAANGAGPLRALVNAAALFDHDVIETLTRDHFERQMRVNAYAPSALAKAFAALLPADARGAIVNFLDFKLATPYPDHYSYTLSKYALAGATEMLARALAPRIRVNAVAPGYVLPAPGQDEADYRKKHALTPLARGTEADDIAHAVRFLIENPAVTGQTIFVDSGLRFESFKRDIGFAGP